MERGKLRLCTSTSSVVLGIRFLVVHHHGTVGLHATCASLPSARHHRGPAAKSAGEAATATSVGISCRQLACHLFLHHVGLEATIRRSEWIIILLTQIAGRRLLLQRSSTIVEVGRSADGCTVRWTCPLVALVGARSFALIGAGAKGHGSIHPSTLSSTFPSGKCLQIPPVLGPHNLPVELVNHSTSHDDLLSILCCLLHIILPEVQFGKSAHRLK